MTFRTRPYPLDGVELVGGPYEAEMILSAAVAVDGPPVIPQSFYGMIRGRYNEAIPPEVMTIPVGFRVQVTGGLSRLRLAVAELWRNMTPRSRAEFLAAQALRELKVFEEALQAMEQGSGLSMPPPWFRLGTIRKEIEDWRAWAKSHVPGKPAEAHALECRPATVPPVL